MFCWAHKCALLLGDTVTKLFCMQVREAQQQLRSQGTDIEEMVAAAEVKDADNTKLWDQVKLTAFVSF